MLYIINALLITEHLLTAPPSEWIFGKVLWCVFSLSLCFQVGHALQHVAPSRARASSGPALVRQSQGQAQLFVLLTSSLLVLLV